MEIRNIMDGKKQGEVGCSNDDRRFHRCFLTTRKYVAIIFTHY